MKKILFLIIASAILYPATAQYEKNALLFSQTFPTLSARSLGMGGAFTSLGGDLSAAYLNPAGLGIYRKSELTISPGLGYEKSSSSYLMNSEDDFKYHFIFGSAGFVTSYNPKREKGLVGASFAIAYNRLNDYNNSIYIEGVNQDNSLAYVFRDSANHYSIPAEELIDYPLVEAVAFDAWVIDTLPGLPTIYQANVLPPVEQIRTITTDGGKNEWSIGFGLNFSHIFYIGMGVGINQINFSKTLIHSESDNSSTSLLNNFSYTENLDLKGTAASVKIGFIVRPIPILRLSAALHAPVYYNVSEDYKFSINSAFDDGYVPYVEPLYGEFDYKLYTPLRVLGGASVQIGKVGLIAVDAEYIDYSNINYRGNKMKDYNNTIQNLYKPVVNLKAGGEVRFGQLSVRAGGGFYPSPAAANAFFEMPDYVEYTGGIGYRMKHFYMDLGFSALLSHEEKYSLYYNNIADLKFSRYRIISTIGFRF